MNVFARLAGAFMPKLLDVIDQAVPDKDQAAQLKAQLQLAVLQADAAELEARAAVIIAEAQGESWLQRNWRPVTMLTFVAILANNFVLVPYALAFGLEVPMLEIPPGMWGLLTVGIGGYVAGRTAEKLRGNDEQRRAA